MNEDKLVSTASRLTTEIAPERDLFGPRRGLWRYHGAVLVYLDAGTSIRDFDGGRSR